MAISCYKPSNNIDKIISNDNKSIWTLVDEHLGHLAKYSTKDSISYYIGERDPRIIYDRVVSYYVQRGYQVPLDAKDFQKGLRDRYVERDGMFFSSEQAAVYESKKKLSKGFVPMGIIVSDEASGIQWLKNNFRKKSMTYQEIHPDWMQALQGKRKNDIIPELKTLLEENFIRQSDGKWRIPNANDEKDLEILRTKALLKEFKLYVEQASKPKSKIKEARVEALRAGFKQCYIDKDFKTIVMLGDKIPENLLTEDEVLLQYYDIASSKV